MVTPELKWPITNLTPSPTKLLATETPCFGSETSSPKSTLIFLPRMPPAALMSSAACWVPFFICAPVAAFGPVIGPPTPNLTWADAEPANAHAKPSARPSVAILFMLFPLRLDRLVQPCCDVTSRLSAAPAQHPVRRVDPPILRDHLRGTRGAKTEASRDQADRAVDGIVMQRQQCAAEKRKVNETHGGAEDQHVEDDLPPRPPCRRHGAAGKPRRAAAQYDGDENKNAERVFLVENARNCGGESGLDA